MRVLWNETALLERTGELAREIVRDYGRHPPYLIGVMNGAAPFLMALVGHLYAAYGKDLAYATVAASSYRGQTGADVTLRLPSRLPILGRRVLLVDDIVDRGTTVAALMERLAYYDPQDIQVCALLTKTKHTVPVAYRGFTLYEDRFVVGFGLDLNDEYRALPFIGVLDDE